jgi:hypothetical protein
MRFEENEVVMLLLGVGVLLFMLLRRPQLKQLPAATLLILGFSILLSGWAATVLEGLFVEGSLYYQLFNYLEHFCYAGSAVMIAWWSWRAFAVSRES